MDEKDGGGANNRPQFGNRFLTDPQNVFQHNAWDNVVWDSEQEEAAKRTTQQQLMDALPSEECQKYEKEAGRFWDEFYTQHQNKFFKDRNWLFTEFPELYSTSSDFPQATASEDLASTSSGHPSGQGSADQRNLRASAPAGDGPSTPSLTSGHCPVPNSSAGEEEASACNAGSSLAAGGEKTSADQDEKNRFCILEVGCGVGNTVFPLLQTNADPRLMIYCCDFSSTAIDIVKKHALYCPRRCHAFVWDVTDTTASLPFPPASLDIITVIFVLSALSPEKMQGTVIHLASLLKPGGQILFRDYGRYDMAQLRFKKNRCLGENFYVRGDGTRVYFFTQEEARAMFTQAGLVEEQNLVDRRLQVNRGRQLKMYRVWLQCKYRKPDPVETGPTC